MMTSSNAGATARIIPGYFPSAAIQLTTTEMDEEGVPPRSW